MNRNGFTATTIVISIVMLVSIVILFMLSRNETNASLTNSISLEIKKNLADATLPNCSWGIAPHIVLTSNVNSAVIVLKCSHIEGIATKLTDYLSSQNSTNNISKFINIFANIETNELNVTIENISETKKGYTILFCLESTDVGNYYLELKENVICTEKKCNKSLKSDTIKISK